MLSISARRKSPPLWHSDRTLSLMPRASSPETSNNRLLNHVSSIFRFAAVVLRLPNRGTMMSNT
jgi:hypothetical protein